MRHISFNSVMTTGAIFCLCHLQKLKSGYNRCVMTLSSHHHPVWPWVERAGHTCLERSPSLSAPTRSCRQEGHKRQRDLLYMLVRVWGRLCVHLLKCQYRGQILNYGTVFYLVLLLLLLHNILLKNIKPLTPLYLSDRYSYLLFWLFQIKTCHLVNRGPILTPF